MGRRYKQLSLEERCTIARLQDEGASLRQIAAALHRAPSTVTREMKRNRARTRYQPTFAQERTRARRWAGSRLDRNPDLRRAVLERLAMGWSPEQVAARLARQNGGHRRISHESIYRFIYAQIARSKDYSWRHYLPRAKSKRGFCKAGRPRKRSGRLLSP